MIRPVCTLVTQGRLSQASLRLWRTARDDLPEASDTSSTSLNACRDAGSFRASQTVSVPELSAQRSLSVAL